MSVKTDNILEKLKSLTVLETADLVKQIEDAFGVNASPQMPIIEYFDVFVKPDVPPVQTDFDVVLDEVPADKKIAILMVVRSLTGLGLREAKDFVESVPKVVKEAIAFDIASDIKAQLEAAGAKVSIK
ncbi:50S ribosomal protein L7/L12 [Microcoleus sp. FACHB-831]|uniref:50S ribosomal protein L7/L12 n=1 Tax=Microcoleus sp. FACHB-831 TaxID=2692827 RepID=UPI001688E3CC|nr:50S ribosomal protein L7/L12 [Microcoleus sp. FACHB-831]MBD1921428.1 50S ribosomal protein L7/L12 [Microcoleus sp. FACHB-831]